ncbi:cyclic nucleotide-binding domain-containing protein [Actinomadura violacea]|uniref:Cyclic nucleotide-binding domain-containing protein n=1 Tax=Actinomadura violacea TaxID=2819934 RepID=A0ABS3S741_9ACTN|nr:cyclic nucleotide-binding domain-containing protein [Actinomadura violacea]MBO2464819.1 cyclic nucleotide-binding domain-containing protein [Actinomadura violacea]
MPSPDRAWRRLLEAFSDASAHPRPGTGTAAPGTTAPADDGRARRLLEAFSDASPAFAQAGPWPGPAGGAPVLGRSLAWGLVVFAALGAACTAWAAAETGTRAAAVVAALTFAVLALFAAPLLEFARARTAPARAQRRSAPLAQPEAEDRESFWHALDSAERRALRDAARLRSFGPRTPILRQGHPADYVVVIRSGWTKVRVDRAGEELIVAVRGPGDLIGERALLDGDAWSATVIALGTVKALVVAAADFRRIVEDHPGVQSVLEKQAHDRAVDEAARVAGTELADTERRLAALFTTLSRARGRTLPVTGGQLAGWTSSSPATVDSVLTQWRDEGLVRSRSGTIDVLNPARLELLTDAAPPPDARPGAPFLTGQNCAVVVTDVVGFDSPARSDSDRAAIRKVLYRSLEESFAAAGVPWAACHHEDRGDGVLLVVPPGIPVSAPAGPLAGALAERLARHYGAAAEGRRFQVRVAVDTGPVLAAPGGVTGAVLARAGRLLDADVLRRRLGSGAAVLGLIVSPLVHQLAAPDVPGFEPVDVPEPKDAGPGTAWLRLYPAPAMGT